MEYSIPFLNLWPGVQITPGAPVFQKVSKSRSAQLFTVCWPSLNNFFSNILSSQFFILRNLRFGCAPFLKRQSHLYQISYTNNIISIKYRPSSVAGNLHCHPFRNSCSYHIPDRCPTQIVNEIVPKLSDDSDRLRKEDADEMG